MIHLGDRLGLFRALPPASRSTSVDAGRADGARRALGARVAAGHGRGRAARHRRRRAVHAARRRPTPCWSTRTTWPSRPARSRGGFTDGYVDRAGRRVPHRHRSRLRRSRASRAPTPPSACSARGPASALGAGDPPPPRRRGRQARGGRRGCSTSAAAPGVAMAAIAEAFPAAEVHGVDLSATPSTGPSELLAGAPQRRACSSGGPRTSPTPAPTTSSSPSTACTT